MTTDLCCWIISSTDGTAFFRPRHWSIYCVSIVDIRWGEVETQYVEECLYPLWLQTAHDCGLGLVPDCWHPSCSSAHKVWNISFYDNLFRPSLLFQCLNYIFFYIDGMDTADVYLVIVVTIVLTVEVPDWWHLIWVWGDDREWCQAW